MCKEGDWRSWRWRSFYLFISFPIPLLQNCCIYGLYIEGFAYVGDYTGRVVNMSKRQVLRLLLAAVTDGFASADSPIAGLLIRIIFKQSAVFYTRLCCCSFSSIQPLFSIHFLPHFFYDTVSRNIYIYYNCVRASCFRLHYTSSIFCIPYFPC